LLKTQNKNPYNIAFPYYIMKRLIVFVICIVFLISLISAFSVGRFSISSPDYCGNELVLGNEECDGVNLGGQTCVSLGYDSGDLSCTGNCTFNELGCVVGGGGGGGGGGGTTRRECNDNFDNDDDTLIDYPDDPGCSNSLDDSEQEIICISDWKCDDWGGVCCWDKKKKLFRYLFL